MNIQKRYLHCKRLSDPYVIIYCANSSIQLLFFGLSFSNINPLDSFLTGGYKRKATDIKTI